MRRHLILIALVACGPAKPTTGVPPPLVIAPDAAVTAILPTPAAAMTCTAGDPQGDFNPYDQRRVVNADADACDAHGDLVDHQCELRDLVCPGGGGRDRHMTRPCYEQTGAVTTATIACDGRCVDGACPARCPAFGDRLTYDQVAPVIFHSDHDARRIACALGYDQPSDAYDCARDPHPGDVLVVEGLGLSTSMCTGGVWGAVSDARCTYTDCRYVD